MRDNEQSSRADPGLWVSSKKEGTNETQNPFPFD